MIIVSSTIIPGILHRRITANKSVMGVVRQIKKSADIPPITRQKTKKPWFTLSRVIDTAIHGTGLQLQYTGLPPYTRTRPVTLMKANQNGTIKSPARVLILMRARKTREKQRRPAMNTGAIYPVDRRQR